MVIFVLNNRQGQVHVKLDHSCVKSGLDQETFSPISLFLGAESSGDFK